MIKTLTFSGISTSKVKLNLKWIFLCEKPQFDHGWLLVKGLTKKSTRNSTIWLFGFLHEMNRKLFVEARPTNRIKKRCFLFKKQAPLWLKTIILNFLFSMTCRLKLGVNTYDLNIERPLWRWCQGHEYLIIVRLLTEVGLGRVA